MRRCLLGWSLVVILVLSAQALVAQESKVVFRKGEFVEGVPCQSDPTQTYTLYLPSDFGSDREWPALLIFDPRGRSVQAAELFREAAEEYGWVIISSNDTRSDGPMEPNHKAINALWPEVHLRYPTDYDRIYIAGFSGGAMMAWQVGYQTGEVAGVIAAGGRFEPSNYKEKLEFPTFGGVGVVDFNYPEMREVHRQLEKWGTDQRLEVFPGRHSWMPEPVARRGVEWMELLAMRDGLREPDPTLITRWLEAEHAEARAYEAEGDLPRAADLLATIESSYRGLGDLIAVTADLERLEEGRELSKGRKALRRADEYAANYRDRLFDAFALMTSRMPPLTAAEFRSELGLAALQTRVDRGGYEATVAQRVLEMIYTQTSFYITRDLFARKDYRRAVPVLEIASEIHPELPYVWYQLACAQARSGQAAPALDALERAVQEGWNNLQWTAKDPDLESLHGEARFRRLIQSAE